jgi:cobalt/nickel transport system permease protein
MRHDFIDRYSRIRSPVHGISAAMKLFVAIVFICTAVVSPLRAWWIFLAVWGVLLAVTKIGKLPWRFVLWRLLLLEPFALGVAAMALFQKDGLTVFIGIFVKSTTTLLVVILLSNTTPFSELHGVLRRAGVPSLLITILALTYRYLFILIDESERITRARISRTFLPNRTSAWMSGASLVGQLFVRSTERAERVFAAMASRGWK